MTATFCLGFRIRSKVYIQIHNCLKISIDIDNYGNYIHTNIVNLTITYIDNIIDDIIGILIMIKFKMQMNIIIKVESDA